MDFHLSCAFRLAVVYWFCLEIKFYRLSGAGWRFSLQVVLWGAPAAEHHPPGTTHSFLFMSDVGLSVSGENSAKIHRFIGYRN